MMWKLDREYWELGFTRIAGVDEVGRGCLCGPVIAAAYIIDQSAELLPVKDSKQLSPERREQLYPDIIRVSTDYAIGLASAKEIDRINILEASRLAMHRAIRGLKTTPDLLLVDGLPLPGTRIRQEAIVKGDTLIGCIASASIIAKVTRDTLMKSLHRRFPAYRLDVNKGYSTSEHREALQALGPCPLHRMSFNGVGQQRLGWQ